jgi:hypothetical protein
MDIIIVTAILWILSLVCLKMYKDKIISMHIERNRLLEEKWTRGQKKKL